MKTSARGAVRVLILPVLLAALAAACSSSSTPAPANTPAPTAAATAAAPSVGLGGGGSLALPSLPNQATDLEAMLPATFCSQPVTKASVAGAAVLGPNVDPTFAAALQALGKTPNDVSAAFGTVTAASSDPNCSVNFFALRIAGADQSQLQQVYEAAATKGGDTITHVNLGGKDVIKDTQSDGSSQYIIMKGDTAIGVSADSDAAAGAGIAALP
jgi:hypothetical protein